MQDFSMDYVKIGLHIGERFLLILPPDGNSAFAGLDLAVNRSVELEETER